MSKLYPPYIEGTIPAFCDTKEGTVLTVPFSMNRAVNKKEVAGFYLKIKTIQSDRYFITEKSTQFDLEKQEVYFDLTNYKNQLNIGQFYKVQIAYIGTDIFSSIGYYSSVGIVKYTSRPDVYIEGLNKNSPNRHTYNYLGYYTQESLGENDIKDYTEKEYSYRFTIFDKNKNNLYDTGWLLHNNSLDVNSYESYDECIYTSDLDVNQVYFIQYHIKTNNGLQVSSPKYRIISTKSIQPDVKTKPILALNFDNGYVDVNLDSKNYIVKYGEEEIENPVSGSFVLLRKTNTSAWEEVHRFALINEKLSEWHWKDFTVEQGKTYIYAIQEYNDYSLYSDKVISDEIYVDFEDSFLFDGKRQLKIKYNPKISSFKTDLLENKVDTIGSKFPFIFRNGNVEYKEFPISGLVSYQMDEDDLFIDKENRFSNKYNNINRIGTFNKDKIDIETYEKLGFSYQQIFQLSQKYKEVEKLKEFLTDDKKKTTDLIGYNISAERDFKLKVLDWLNNGKPKLFRSPNEGNYIIRLLNTSLSPEDTLGRMLHTFNSTAYEIAKCDYENLNKYGFINIYEPNTTQLRWISIRLLDKCIEYRDSEERYIELMQHKKATSVYFYDMLPGEMVRINGNNIIIGATGTYFIDNGEIIESIQIPTKVIYSGTVTYSYEDNSKNTFDTIVDVEVEDIVAHQFIGYYENILNIIEDLKNKISNFYYLDFNKRDITKVYPHWLGKEYEKDGNRFALYSDKNCTSKLSDVSVTSDALQQKLEQNYQNQIKIINDYYNAENEQMRNSAYNALEFEILDEYYYRLRAPYYTAYEKGEITRKEYEEKIQKIKDENKDAIQFLVSQIDDESIDIYIADTKKIALEKAKEKYLLSLSLFRTINRFEKNPFTIYQYNLSQYDVETSHGLMTIVGFAEVELEEEDFILPESILKDRYYILNKDYEYESVMVYDEKQTYYMKKPFEFYYDPKQPMSLFVSEDTNKRIKEFEAGKKEVLKEFEIQTEFIEYSTKFWIDGNEFDLNEDINFKINSLSLFNEIKMSVGVVLNCGYELQIVEYFDEAEIEGYQFLKDLKQLLKTNQKDITEEFFDQLLLKTGLDDTLNTLKENYEKENNQKITYLDAKRIFYDDIIFSAWKIYDASYYLYLNKLAYKLKEKGVIE